MICSLSPEVTKELELFNNYKNNKFNISGIVKNIDNKAKTFNATIYHTDSHEPVMYFDTAECSFEGD